MTFRLLTGAALGCGSCTPSRRSTIGRSESAPKRRAHYVHTADGTVRGVQAVGGGAERPDHRAPDESGRRNRDVPVSTAAFGSARAMAVPATAIVRDQDRTRVYVQRTPEALELRDVKIGRTNGPPSRSQTG